MVTARGMTGASFRGPLVCQSFAPHGTSGVMTHHNQERCYDRIVDCNSGYQEAQAFLSDPAHMSSCKREEGLVECMSKEVERTN
jgi:hypothetical protein